MRLMCVIYLLTVGWASWADTTAKIITTQGVITIKLYDELAPKIAKNFEQLATGEIRYTMPDGKKVTGRPFYDGLIFHRVHPDLGIFSGCPWGNGRGWPGYFFEAKGANTEFSRPGIVAMAKINGENRIGSQFFITTKPMPRLNGKYPIFGEVIAGMDIVHKIANVERDVFMAPKSPIKITKIEIIP